MTTITAAVVGASGYVGGELLRTLLAHPGVTIGVDCGHECRHKPRRPPSALAAAGLPGRAAQSTPGDR